MEISILPFAIFLIFIIQQMMKRAIFYNPVTREWKKDIKWYHYAQYIALIVFFSSLCLTPCFPNITHQIGRYHALSNGYRWVEYEDEKDEVYKDLPNSEFIIMYEVKSSVGSDEIMNEIIPDILECQKKWSEWGVMRGFGDYDFGREYVIRYDSEKQLFLLYSENEVAADIAVKRKPFFKIIYFHGYKNGVPK